MDPARSFDSHPSPSASQTLPPDRARRVLRKLRDLDLHTGKLEIDAERFVRVDGCLSPDAPLAAGATGEMLLRYRLAASDGEACIFEIGHQEGSLVLRLLDENGQRNTRKVALLLDPEGRATVPDLAARMSPDSSSTREVEHFLRRLVRGAFAGTTPDANRP